MTETRCPYFQELGGAHYCRAEQGKRVITQSVLQSFAPCTGEGYRNCPVYLDWLYWKSQVERLPILVVEDEAIMRESLRDWLVEGGFEVIAAEDGEQALQVIGGQRFGIAVLDLKLPGKDGIEVLREAKKQRPDFKAIIITAYPSAETVIEARKSGAIDYLIKPFPLDTLDRVIKEALEEVKV